MNLEEEVAKLKAEGKGTEYIITFLEVVMDSNDLEGKNKQVAQQMVKELRLNEN